MARSDLDKVSIWMRRTPAGLAPVDAVDAERLAGYSLGATVEVTVKQHRSGPNHRHFFSFLGRLVESGAVPFTSTSALLDALKMTLGVTELRQGIGGQPYFVPGSISFAAKDEAAFRDFKTKALALIAQHYGVNVDDVLEERAA